MEQQVEKLLKEAKKIVDAIATMKEFDDVRVRYLGNKGEVTSLLKGLGALSSEERPAAGQAVNMARKAIEELLADKKKEIQGKETELNLQRQVADISLPGVDQVRGTRHPVIRVMNEMLDIFRGMGFTVRQGPEVEKDYYNFEALNIPKDHPARDMQDTFYVDEDIVLRTHTSPVQIRAMEKQDPPLRIVSPGRVYRHDYDVTHSPMFHQVEGFMVDEGVAFSDLKGL